MSNDINNFTLVGRLTRDCELLYTKSGSPMLKFSIASNRKFRDKENTSFFDMVLFGNFATIMNKYLNKGVQIIASGYAEQNRWNDNHGNYKSKINFIVQNLQLIGGKRDNNITPDNSQSDDDYPF